MFTYRDYYDMISTLFEDQRIVYVRHDVDISLEKAVQMAEREHKLKLPSTYFILLSSRYYNPFTKESKRYVEQLLNLGHTIGLHYDLSLAPSSPEDQAKYVLWQRSIMEAEFGVEISTCSAHKPSMGVSVTRELATILQISGLHDVNLTMPNYKYISDSGMNWREDYHEVIKHYTRIHVNTHPIWYDDIEGDYKDRLRSLRLDLKGDTLINDEILSIGRYHEILHRNPAK